MTVSRRKLFGIAAGALAVAGTYEAAECAADRSFGVAGLRSPHGHLIVLSVET